MQLYNVAAWKTPRQARDHASDEVPAWEAQLVADSVEEAYRKGVDLFHTERPDLRHEEYAVEASY